MSMIETDSSDEASTNWQSELQSFRLMLTSRVEYKRISTCLQSYFIIDKEDDEELVNQYRNPTNTSKINLLVDKLLKKGEANYNKFIETVLGGFYPELYKELTGREPKAQPDVVPPPPVTDFTMMRSISGSEDVIHILMERLEMKKMECEKLVRQVMVTDRDLEERSRDIMSLKTQIEEYQTRSERYESMERDMSALKDVVDQVKNENYKVCMRLVDINEENSRLREHNMALRMENDKAKVDLRKMESTVNSERSVSVRLRKTLETGPSEKVIRTLHQEIDDLKLKLAQSNRGINNVDNDIDTRFQILQTDKDEAIQMCAETTEKLNRLREEFNSTETLRDKYLEENERLILQISALTDDCEMYKTRRDANWQQLQEVEKERDQLMKERNEAQLTAQTHMDEKTKYRAEIRKLEEKHDKLCQQLREKETLVRGLQNRLKKLEGAPELPGVGRKPSGSDTTSVPSPEFLVKSEFDSAMDLRSVKADGIFPEIPLAANYGKGCHLYEVRQPEPESPAPPNSQHKRKRVIRKNRNDSKQVHTGSMNYNKKNSDSHSRTSSESSCQRKSDKEESSSALVEVGAESLQKCVKLIGGNHTGIFINQIVDTPGHTQTCGGLQPGMQLLKLHSHQRIPVSIHRWTLEYANNIFHNLEGIVTLTVEHKQKEFQDLKDKMRNSRLTGDSFYVRANFKWTMEDMLNFNKYEVLHVINTQPYTEMHWLACKIDPYNGNNASRSEVIPSYKYCMKHPQAQDQVITKGRRFTEPNLFAGNDQREPFVHHSMSVKLPPKDPTRRTQISQPCYAGLVIGRPEASYEHAGQPYTLVQPVKSVKDKPRPCLLLPQSLAKVLSFKLTTIAEPLLFDFPLPESTNCTLNAVRSRLFDRDVVSFNSVSDEMQEIVTVKAVHKVANMGKHCLLSINENCISIKEYLRKLQAEDIFPIIVLLQTDKQKILKFYIEENKNKPTVVIQDMILAGEQLKRFACNYVTVSLDRCNRIEDAVQLLMEKVADETNRIVWQEEDEEIYI